MKYLLFLFILASFLFSQVTAVENVKSNEDQEVFDENGRPIGAEPGSVLIQNEMQQVESEALIHDKQFKEFDENGRLLNAKPGSAAVLDETQQLESILKSTEYDENGRSINAKNE